jgi:MinD superfamily P-loop ATPase
VALGKLWWLPAWLYHYKIKKPVQFLDCDVEEPNAHIPLKPSLKGLPLLMPPGTSCPVIEAVKGSDFCLLVTEPTPFGLNDLVLAIDTVKELSIPCGVVINRDGVGDSKVEEHCLEGDIPILLRIPLDIEIARLYSRGIALVEGMPHWQEAFLKLYNDIEQAASV